jgi:hypothetical protein
MAAAGSGDWTLSRRLPRKVQPCWAYIVASLLVSFLSGTNALLGPLPFKIAVDSWVDARPLPGFFTALLPGTVLDSILTLLEPARTTSGSKANV